MRASETLRAPAKLNLTLEVLNRRPDGLHGLRSVMVPVDVFDELEFAPSQRGLEFVCDDSKLQRDNLAERALNALDVRETARVSLRKRIPVGAGMGGGSSDAAAVLLAAQRGIVTPRTPVDYLALARSLGSDVPFFLVRTAALVEGAGERVTALGPVPHWHAVVVKPPVAVSTADAYGRIDARGLPSRPRNSSVSLRLGEALQRSEFETVQALVQNDFHDAIAVEVPEIATALEALSAAGAAKPMLTGSGSCVFALTQTANDRDAIASALRLPDGYRAYACSLWNGAAWRSAA